MSLYPVTSFFCRGFTLIELLVSLLLFSLGLLGYGALQQQIQTQQLTLVQRNQVINLVAIMANQLELNYLAAECYNLGKIQLGVGDQHSHSCKLDIDAEARARAEEDINQWHRQLQGLQSIAVPLNARGCIERQKTTNSYSLTLAWQGLKEHSISLSACGDGQYADNRLRRIFTYSVNLPGAVSP